MLTRDHLHNYQRRAVDFIRDTPACALWCDPGMGKTAITLTAIADLYEAFDVGRALIIAPPRVARDTWPAEVGKWEQCKGLSVELIAGSPARRERILANSTADVHVISADLVTWLVPHVLSKGDWSYDFVAIDEASMFKSPSAQRFKALRKVRPQIDRIVELTGTPTSNSLLDVWSQIFLLDRGTRLGRTYGLFQQRWFDPDYHGYNWTLRDGSEAEIHAALQDIALTMSADDYLDLPDQIDTDVFVELPKAAREQYKELEREALLVLDSDEVVSATQAATLTNKLSQFANGAVYPDLPEGAPKPRGPRPFEVVHSAKLDALGEIIDQYDGKPIMVPYTFQSDVARIVERFPQARSIAGGVDMVARWNAGTVPVMPLHPKSAGHGLNLQDGGHVLAWFGLPWSLELYLQTNARLRRQGQRYPVVNHRIIARDTIDETMSAGLARHGTSLRSLLNALKEDIVKRST